MVNVFKSFRKPETGWRKREPSTGEVNRRYVHNVQPVISKMLLRDVRSMHCKKILIGMDADYAGSTIRQAYIAMGTMFRSAVMNGMSSKHPMDGVRYTKPVRVPDDIKFLTVEEQDKFLEAAKGSPATAQSR